MSNTDYDADAFKAFEEAGWQDVAGTYLESFANVTGQALEPLLDVACGPGRLTAEAARRGAEASGVDLVPAMIAEATRLHPDCAFRQGDAEALPYEEGAFEAVVCSFGILHFPRPERAIAEALRVLAPGGRYAFTAWALSDGPTATGLVQEAVERHGSLAVDLPPGPPPRLFGDPQTCRGVLEEVGFADIAVRELPVVVPLERAEALIPLLMAGTARNRGLLVRQTPEALGRIEMAVTETVRAFPTADGFAVPNPALLVVGRKP